MRNPVLWALLINAVGVHILHAPLCLLACSMSSNGRAHIATSQPKDSDAAAGEAGAKKSTFKDFIVQRQAQRKKKQEVCFL